jgi:hypothetical protein
MGGENNRHLRCYFISPSPTTAGEYIASCKSDGCAGVKSDGRVGTFLMASFLSSRVPANQSIDLILALGKYDIINRLDDRSGNYNIINRLDARSGEI